MCLSFVCMSLLIIDYVLDKERQLCFSLHCLITSPTSSVSCEMLCTLFSVQNYYFF